MNAFFTTIAVVLIHTPIWVWALYTLLLFLGFQRTRDSSVSLWRMLILPLVVVVFAIVGFIGAGVSGLPFVLFGLVIGSMAGWQLERDGTTRRLADGKIWLRGEWWTLTQLVFIMIFRYIINIVPFLSPALNLDPAWHFGTILVSAFLSAVFLGRTAARLTVYFSPRLSTS